MHEVGAIILAAGLSRRMGAQNKLLLPIRGTPMIRHMVGVYREVTSGPVLVIAGHQGDAVERAMSGADVRVVHNPDFAEGQQTSVACGLRAADPAMRLLIGLGDQPNLTSDDLRCLLDAHAAADPNRISIPLQDERRGNPLVVPDALRARMLDDPRSPGCKRFTRENPEHVQFHDLPASGFYSDIDTPEAYSAFVAQAAEVTS